MKLTHNIPLGHDCWFTYTNYKGEVEQRHVIPFMLQYSTRSDEYHPNPCFLLHSWDCDRQAMRSFDLALIDMETFHVN